MDTFRLCISALPVAAYCLLLGILNLGRRPFLTTGTRDLAALGVALAGLAAVGPMELFMPQAAAMQFGGWVWLLLVSFYGLCVSLGVLLTRPRLVIYNITAEQIRPVLARVASDLDPDARWAGDCLALPRLGVQLYFDTFGAMRNISLASGGASQNLAGWRRLERAVAVALRETEVGPNPRGFSLVTVASLLTLGCVLKVVGSPESLAQGLKEMMQI